MWHENRSTRDEKFRIGSIKKEKKMDDYTFDYKVTNAFDTISSNNCVNEMLIDTFFFFIFLNLVFSTITVLDKQSSHLITKQPIKKKKRERKTLPTIFHHSAVQKSNLKLAGFQKSHAPIILKHNNNSPPKAKKEKQTP